MFNAAYAADITTLLPSPPPQSARGGGQDSSESIASSTPPAAAYAGITPATTPASLAPAFQLGFGPGYLITNAYRLSYLEDAQTAPDGGFPTITDGLPPSNPKNTLRQDLKTNDLRTWVPAAPVLLCGGSADPSVFYLNTRLMQHYWVASAANAPVTVLDVDSPVAANDPYAALNECIRAGQGPGHRRRRGRRSHRRRCARGARGLSRGTRPAVLPQRCEIVSTRASAEGRRPHLLVKLGTDAAGGRIIDPCARTIWEIQARAPNLMRRCGAVDEFIDGYLAYESPGQGHRSQRLMRIPDCLHRECVRRLVVDAPRGARGAAPRGPNTSPRRSERSRTRPAGNSSTLPCCARGPRMICGADPASLRPDAG